MESVTQLQILDETVCISFRANALGKGMDSSVPSSMDTKYTKLDSSALISVVGALPILP